MSEMQLGVVKPQYIQQAVSLGKSIAGSKNAAGKAQAMARHPAGASRSAEFHAQAKAHLNAASANQQTLNSMVSQGESGISALPSSDPGMAQYN